MSTPAAGRAATVTVAASAKINLALRVGGRRPDGYHALATLFQAVDLADELTLVASEPGAAGAAGDAEVEGIDGCGSGGGSGLRLTVTGPEAAGVPTGTDNLVLAALRLLAEHTGHDLSARGVRARLTKRIPAAAGLAGGSADAAAALLAADTLWQTHLLRGELLDLAAVLGADVPFSLTGGTAVGTSRGDVLTPALARGRFHWVLALAAHRLSTPAVFAELDRVRPLAVADDPVLAPGLLAAVRAGDPIALGRVLLNDLQAPAVTLVPALRGCLDAGRRLGALGAIVCGSGPTCAFLAVDAAEARTLAAGLAAEHVARRVLAVTGPAPGARVLSAVG